MALRGNLETFRVEEILQLIASQRKTGVLKLASGDRRAVLVFDEGRIISTHEPGSRDPSSLEASLARMHRLPEPQLNRLEELRAAEGFDPQDIILKANFLQPEALAGFLEEHVQDLLLRTLGWRTGSYEFLNRTLAPSGGSFRLAFRTEGVLMEAMRRLDEMTRWRHVLSNPALRLGCHGTSQAREPDARRRRILEALITPRTLAEVEESLPLWLFELYEGLYELWEAGLLDVQGAQQLKAGEQMRRKLARSPVEQVAFGAGAMVAMAVMAVVSNLLLAPLLTAPKQQAVSVWEEVQVAQYMDDVRLAAERYRLAHGAYPIRVPEVPGWSEPPPGAPNPEIPAQLAIILNDKSR